MNSTSVAFRKFLLILLVSVFIPFEMHAEWLPVGHKNAADSPPKVTILSDDNTGTVIKVELSGFNIKGFVSDGETYQSVDLLTEIFSTQAGFPELPHIAKVLAIPDMASVSVEVLETGKVEVFNNISLPPARVSWWEGQPESAYVENAEAYQSMEIYPAEYAKVEPPSVFRDFRIARVSIFPVRYVPAKKQLQVVSSLTIRVNYSIGAAVNPKTKSTAKREIAPSFGALYRSFIFNYQNKLDNLYFGNETGREVMLCIMPDEFAASFQVYADWKRQSGTDVHITKFSDISANASNPDIIKNHISDAYFNWEYPPTYVLIVGDDGIFPKKIVNYDYSFPNEDYFVEIDGNDFFPELMIGRFTNQADYRMQVMINKFMMYEKTPYITNTDWFKKGICCSNDAYDSQVITKRHTAEVMVDMGGFTSVDTLMSNSVGAGCTMNENDIVNVINNGRSWLNYRGEGWSYGWNANCYSFHTSYISSLNNGEMFTFVTSIGCGVAMFSAGGGNCFGEEWVQLGSLTAPRGGVAFVGPTSNTHTTYNNKIDKGIYQGMFNEGMETPGQGLLRGKLYMYNVFGTDPWVEYHYRVYCILGDPSIHIWKDVPLAVNVSHPAGLPVGYSQTEYMVTFDGSGLPVANAQVCITGDSVFATGYTDTLGKVILGITPPTVDTLTVTARGGNVYPYQGTIEIFQAPEHVGPNAPPVIVDIDGNTNGSINPGENCNVTFMLKNWGSQISNNVQATITTTDTNITVITTSPISYGNLASGSSLAGNPFQILVHPYCPVGHIILFQLNVTSSTTTWNYQYNTEVSGCELLYKEYVVNDDSASVSNYRMDPGEMVKLFLAIRNVGEDVAPNVMGVLRCNDPFITIEDSIGSFGTLNINAQEMNTGNYFEVNIDTACPIGHPAVYTLELYTQGGSYPYKVVRSFTILVGISGANDFTGPDAYGYYAYCNDDSIYIQSPVYDWFEIEDIGTDIGATSSEFTATVTLPFDFKYYGLNYTELRINTDGWIAFGAGTQTHWANAPLPNIDAVDNMVAIFWDDLYSDTYPEGNIYHYYDDVNHRFIIEWDSIGHYHDGVEQTTEVFQAILLDPMYYYTPTGDGEIIFQYKTVSNPTSNTVGIENLAQDIGLLYVFNNAYDTTATAIRHEMAIKFTTVQPYILLADEGVSASANPPGYSLEQNYPNPFNPNTWISYSIPTKSHVHLAVYDIHGKLVRILQNRIQPEGKHSVMWNGLTDTGNKVGAGVYFYRLRAGDFVATKKMYLLE